MALIKDLALVFFLWLGTGQLRLGRHERVLAALADVELPARWAYAPGLVTLVAAAILWW
jgi:hypothetical protein